LRVNTAGLVQHTGANGLAAFSSSHFWANNA
jgi:hypothetical protein